MADFAPTHERILKIPQKTTPLGKKIFEIADKSGLNKADVVRRAGEGESLLKKVQAEQELLDVEIAAGKFASAPSRNRRVSAAPTPTTQSIGSLLR